jgi:hypothetical protein
MAKMTIVTDPSMKATPAAAKPAPIPPNKENAETVSPPVQVARFYVEAAPHALKSVMAKTMTATVPSTKATPAVAVVAPMAAKKANANKAPTNANSEDSLVSGKAHAQKAATNSMMIAMAL